MDGPPDIAIGERIRFYRQAGRKKQSVVAGLAGISEDYLSQIERGRKTPSTTLLHRLARILAVPTSALLGEPPTKSPASEPLGVELNRALVTAPAADRPPVEIGELRDRVDSMWTTWQTSQGATARRFPCCPT